MTIYLSLLASLFASFFVCLFVCIYICLFPDQFTICKFAIVMRILSILCMHIQILTLQYFSPFECIDGRTATRIFHQVHLLHTYVCMYTHTQSTTLVNACNGNQYYVVRYIKVCVCTYMYVYVRTYECLTCNQVKARQRA